MARIIAAAAAIVGWAALALQLALIVGKLGAALGSWRFLGFFTILTNIAAATVATAVAIGNRGALAGPRARLLAATSITIVGLVYSLALRSLWDPTGMQKVADVLLHDLAPLLFVSLWVLSPHPRLAWLEIGWAVVPPLVYAAYALGRGTVDGWYAYWFLNPAEQTWFELLTAIGVLSSATALIAGAFVFLDRVLANRSPKSGLTH